MASSRELPGLSWDVGRCKLFWQPSMQQANKTKSRQGAVRSLREPYQHVLPLSAQHREGLPQAGRTAAPQSSEPLPPKCHCIELCCGLSARVQACRHAKLESLPYQNLPYAPPTSSETRTSYALPRASEQALLGSVPLCFGSGSVAV